MLQGYLERLYAQRHYFPRFIRPSPIASGISTISIEPIAIANVNPPNASTCSVGTGKASAVAVYCARICVAVRSIDLCGAIVCTGEIVATGATSDVAVCASAGIAITTANNSTTEYFSTAFTLI